MEEYELEAQIGILSKIIIIIIIIKIVISIIIIILIIIIIIIMVILILIIKVCSIDPSSFGAMGSSGVIVVVYIIEL